MTNINHYFKTILATLKEMGKETATCELLKGGLRCYPDHHNCPNVPRIKKCRGRGWENPYWDGLACRLTTQKEIDTKTQENYSSNICDLVLRPNSELCIRIEGKVLMERRTWNETTNLFYWESCVQQADPWRDGLRDVGGKDYLNLTTGGKMNATHIALLVVAFGCPGGPFEQPSFLEMLPQHVVQEWNSFHPSPAGLSWPDHRREASERGFTDKMWLWYQRV
jgi:hypothetical protein